MFVSFSKLFITCKINKIKLTVFKNIKKNKYNKQKYTKNNTGINTY